MAQLRPSLLITAVWTCILVPSYCRGQVTWQTPNVIEVHPSWSQEGSAPKAPDDRSVTPTAVSQPQEIEPAPKVPAAGERLEQENRVLEEGTVLRLVVQGSGKDVRLRPGETHEWSLLRAVFAKDRQVIPVGSRLRMLLESAPRRDATWKAVAHCFLNGLREPEGCKRDPNISVKSASLTLPDSTKMSLDLSLIRIARTFQVGAAGGSARQTQEGRTEEKRASARDRAIGRSGAAENQRTLILRLNQRIVFPELALSYAVATTKSSSGEATLQTGTQIRLMLLTPLRASKNHEGDTVQARLLEPVQQDGRLVLPEGVLVEGRITHLVPPRRLQRPGSFRLSLFMVTPEGFSGTPLSASVVYAETDERDLLKVDAEGTLRGGPQGKKAQLARLGVSFLTGKIADDLFETGLKLTVASVSSGAAATAARYVGMGTALLMFLGSRGKDVTLPQFSELDLTLTRPAAVTPRRTRTKHP